MHLIREEVSEDMTSRYDNDDKIAGRRLTIPPLHQLSTQHVTCTDTYEKKKSESISNDLIAGGVGGLAGIIVGHPFDSMKVRYQMAAATSSLEVKQFYSVSSLFRGIGAPIMTAGLVNASIFTTYNFSSGVFDRYVNFDNSGYICGLPKQVSCGCFTGIVSSIILCPTELVKIKMQTQINGAETAYRSSFHAARSIFANHGIQGLYRGFVATSIRQGIGFGVYFSSYDRLKYHLKYQLGAEHSWLPSILAGGIAGSLSWAVIYPVDLIKSRIQALSLSTTSKAELSISNITKNTIQQQGWQSLYRGLGITVFRAFPVNGVIFPTYELTLSMLSRG